MIDTLLSTPLFGLTLTCVCWCAGIWLQKKTGWELCNPLLIAVALILCVLSVCNIPYETYNEGGQLITLLLGPATAVLALNIYRQRALLKEYFLPVLIGCLAGVLSSLGIILLLCKLFTLPDVLAVSLLPKSVTTAIAIGIAESRGGVAGIAIAGVTVAGLTGMVFSPLFAKLFHIQDPIAEGLAIGASSHALGTTKAMKIGSVQGAMSSIALCVCGIITALITLFLV